MSIEYDMEFKIDDILILYIHKFCIRSKSLDTYIIYKI